MARIAPTLARCRTALDKEWPLRDRRSDGWIGDSNHVPPSDHIPNGRGMVDALDVDSDGIHVPTVLAAMITHPATNYVIHNRRIYQDTAQNQPRTYTGSNPHTGHIHCSIHQSTWAEDSPGSWSLITMGPQWQTMVRGDDNAPGSVRQLQAYLNAYGASLRVDGDFGPLTDSAVRRYQVRHKVTHSVTTVHGAPQGDGIVGPYTRASLAGQ